jgi:hypothetical protein
MAKRIDWVKVKNDYLTHADIGYRVLAKKYHCNRVTIAERGGKENWVELKKNTLKKIDLKTVEKSVDAVSADVIRFNHQKDLDGQKLIEKGLTGIRNTTVLSPRIGKELVEVGYKLRTEAMGLDKPGASVVVNNNILSVTDFAEAIQKRKLANTND